MSKGFFRPDMAFYDVYAISPELLQGLGIKGVVFDIDNTIAPYEIETPTTEMNDYFDSLRKADIKMAFVSNNNGARVTKFNEGLGLYYVCKAGKPSPKGVRKCIEHFGLEDSEVVAVGDQIFTDCIAAHRAGIKCFLVKPIKDKETLFFKMKRFFERPFVRNLKWRRRTERKNPLKRERKRLFKKKIFKFKRNGKEIL